MQGIYFLLSKHLSSFIYFINNSWLGIAQPNPNNTSQGRSYVSQGSFGKRFLHAQLCSIKLITIKNKLTMKKTIKTLALAAIIGLTPQFTNAQGFLKKLAAAMAPKPINGVWDMGTGANGKFAYAQAGTQFTQFDHPKENSDKKLEINYTGSAFGTRFERFTCFNIPKIYLEREMQPNWYMFQTEDSTFFIVNRMENYKFDASKNLLGIVTSNKALIKELLDWDKKTAPTTDLIKKNVEEVQNLCNKIIKAGEDAEADRKKKEAEHTANLKLPAPTKINPCNQAKLQELCQTRVGNDKIAYCYFGIPDLFKPLSPTNDWRMKKEKKTVNGTYDSFITARQIFVICVYQTEENVKAGIYNHTCITIEEEHAFDVWDGSKFNGVLKAVGTSYLGRITKENALQYKDVLK